MLIFKMAAQTTVDFPSEISVTFSEFRDCLKAVETVLEPVFSTSISETREKFETLDRAKFDLVSAYALNSLFFMYLRAHGEDAQEHDIKKELERIRSNMCRVKDAVDRQTAMRVNVPAVKRFVRNALWTPKDQEDVPNKKRKTPKADAVQTDDASEGKRTNKLKEKRKKCKK